MNPGIAIFVKTPGRSPVKTRLAEGVGQAFAEDWHMQAATAVAAVAREAARSGQATTYWAVAEREALADPRWNGLPVLDQGDGGLGARMHHVHAALVERHQAGILLGADTPQIDPRWLDEALDWLRSPTPRLVIGPAADGGFWLLGANRSLPRELWGGVPYSVPETTTRLHAALAGRGDWHTLPRLRDVDDIGDLAACRDALAALDAPLPAQTALRTWMERHAPRGVFAA